MPGNPPWPPRAKLCKRSALLLSSCLVSVNNMNSKRHLSMSAAAEDSALALEVSCLLWRNRRFHFLARRHPNLQMQTIDHQAVYNIVGDKLQLGRLALLEGDL